MRSFKNSHKAPSLSAVKLSLKSGFSRGTTGQELRDIRNLPCYSISLLFLCLSVLIRVLYMAGILWILIIFVLCSQNLKTEQSWAATRILTHKGSFWKKGNWDTGIWLVIWKFPMPNQHLILRTENSYNLIGLFKHLYFFKRSCCLMLSTGLEELWYHQEQKSNKPRSN